MNLILWLYNGIFPVYFTLYFQFSEAGYKMSLLLYHRVIFYNFYYKTICFNFTFETFEVIVSGIQKHIYCETKKSGVYAVKKFKMHIAWLWIYRVSEVCTLVGRFFESCGKTSFSWHLVGNVSEMFLVWFENWWMRFLVTYLSFSRSVLRWFDAYTESRNSIIEDFLGLSQ